MNHTLNLLQKQAKRKKSRPSNNISINKIDVLEHTNKQLASQLMSARSLLVELQNKKLPQPRLDFEQTETEICNLPEIHNLDHETENISNSLETMRSLLNKTTDLFDNDIDQIEIQSKNIEIPSIPIKKDRKQLALDKHKERYAKFRPKSK